MSQSGILNRGVYPPGTVVKTLTGNTGGAVGPSLANNINLLSANNNLTIVGNPLTNTLTFTASLSPAISYVAIAFADSPYTASVTTEFISCDTSGGAITINLPSAGVAQGESWIIKDRTGQANVNNITIQSLVGGKTIDTAANYIINASFGSVKILYNGTNYEVY
jgi:hypothetical protein